MEHRREDPLMLLHGSWVEVAPLGAPELPCTSSGGEEEEEEEEDLEAILREAQMEAAAEWGDGPLPALKGPAAEEATTSGQREDPERPPQAGTLAWPWSHPPESLPARDLACMAPACPPLLSPALHRKRGLRDPRLTLLVIPSLLLSHVLALGLGICIGKRLAASSSSAL